MVASQQLGRLAGFSIIVSSGTLLAAIGFGRPALTAAALFYLAELDARGDRDLPAGRAGRARAPGRDRPAGRNRRRAAAGLRRRAPVGEVNLDDEEAPLIGRAIPAALAFLGLAFVVCALLIAGLPPLSGFVAKVAMLSALLDAEASAHRARGRRRAGACSRC